MSNLAKTLLSVVLAGGLLYGGCSGEKSEAEQVSDTSAKKPATAQEEIDVAAVSADAQSATPDAVGGGDAAAAYAAVLDEVRTLQKSATTQERLLAAVSQVGGKFQAFIDQYPDSREAVDAHFQVGIMYASVMQPASAIKHLDTYIEMAPEIGEPEDKIGYAHFYLAESYKNADKWEEAKKYYQIFIKEYGNLNPQAVAQATTMLNDLETLKRLSIGGEPIPFTVTDLEGNKLSLADYKGKVVLLDFWATWCGPCKAEMPNVVRIHNKYKSQGFEIIGISLDSNKNIMESYVSSNNMDWPQHFDGKGWSNGVAMKYKVRSIPATYLIDRKGKIRYRSLRGKALEEAVAELVDES